MTTFMLWKVLNKVILDIWLWESFYIGMQENEKFTKVFNIAELNIFSFPQGVFELKKTIEGLLLSELVGTGTITTDTTLKFVVTIPIKKWVFESSKNFFITILGFLKPVYSFRSCTIAELVDINRKGQKTFELWDFWKKYCTWK